jgi:hypothetical protein
MNYNLERVVVIILVVITIGLIYSVITEKKGIELSGYLPQRYDVAKEDAIAEKEFAEAQFKLDTATQAARRNMTMMEEEARITSDDAKGFNAAKQQEVR